MRLVRGSSRDLGERLRNAHFRFVIEEPVDNSRHSKTIQNSSTCLISPHSCSPTPNAFSAVLNMSSADADEREDGGGRVLVVVSVVTLLRGTDLGFT